jgi:hypothetical protein
MYPSAQTGVIDAFTVAFTSLTISSSSGSDTLTPPGYAEAVILDSGTTFTYVPDDLAEAIYNVVGAQFNSEAGLALCVCSTGFVEGTIDFGFAGADGPVIKVPISELVYPVYDNDGNQPTLQNGDTVCSFGIEPSSSLGSDVALLFGDTILRSAYVVYDLFNARIGLAQTVFNSTKSNIVAFESAGAQIPSATTVTNENAVTQTASADNLGGGGADPTALPTSVDAGTEIAGTSTAEFTGNAGPAFSTALFDTATSTSKSNPTGSGSGGSSSESNTPTGKKSAAVPGVKLVAWVHIALVGATLTLMAVGGGLLL